MITRARRSVKRPPEIYKIGLVHKSQNAPVPYPTMLHSEQKCVFLGKKCYIPIQFLGVDFIGRLKEKRVLMPNVSLHWRDNDHNGVSNHQPHGCLLNRLFRRRSKKTSELRVTGLCVGNSPGPVNSPHKGPVTRKMFSFDDVIMISAINNNPPWWRCNGIRIDKFQCRHHYSDVTWMSWCIELQTTRLFFQQLLQAYSKEKCQIPTIWDFHIKGNFDVYAGSLRL